MSVETGLVVDGRVVPNTDWCLRDTSAWFAPGDYAVKPRDRTMDRIVGHWTAGEAGTGSYEDDGPWVYRVFRARTKNGRKLKVSVHFVIGGCPVHADFAPIWQLADPGLVACFHTGDSAYNARSVSFEMVNKAKPPAHPARPRPVIKRTLLGRDYNFLAFYAGQLASAVRLAETMVEVGRAGIGNIDIPRQVPCFPGSSNVLTRRFTVAEQASWRGACEHLHERHTTKLDAGAWVIQALAQAGWARVEASAGSAASPAPVNVPEAVSPERCCHCGSHLDDC